MVPYAPLLKTYLHASTSTGPHKPNAGQYYCYVILRTRTTPYHHSTHTPSHKYYPCTSIYSTHTPSHKYYLCTSIFLYSLRTYLYTVTYYVPSLTSRPGSSHWLTRVRIYLHSAQCGTNLPQCQRNSQSSKFSLVRQQDFEIPNFKIISFTKW